MIPIAEAGQIPKCRQQVQGDRVTKPGQHYQQTLLLLPICEFSEALVQQF